MQLILKRGTIPLKDFVLQGPTKEHAAIWLKKVIQWLCLLGKWSQARHAILEPFLPPSRFVSLQHAVTASQVPCTVHTVFTFNDQSTHPLLLTSK